MFLEIDKLSKRYSKNSILNNISFKIKKGDIVSIVGPSGSGKTTLLKCISGLCDIDRGSVKLNSKLLTRLEPNQRSIAYVFQESPLFPHLTVNQNILFNLKVFDREKLNFIIEKINIGHLKNRYPHEISGGENQRVAVARSLIRNPDLLLMDEPFSNLDLYIKDKLKELVFELISELKTTTIIVNHDIKDSLEISDKILILINGEINNYDIPHAVYSNPKCLESANLFGVLNRINTNEKIFYCRPEHIKPTSSGIAASVINSKFIGPFYKIRAHINDEKIIFYSDKDLLTGENIDLEIDSKKRIYFD
tara:strand:+ start:2897 stop:3817 length:921 start_codon:yes stop_codon:yes gene_type:complete